MENASKALLIASGVLIAILLLTLFSYLFTKIGENTRRIEEKNHLSETTTFNQQFLNYENKEYLTYLDIATLINLAKDARERSISNVEIVLSGSPIQDKYYNNSYEFLKDFSTNQKKYGAQVHINPQTMLVDRVEVSEKP